MNATAQSQPRYSREAYSQQQTIEEQLPQPPRLRCLWLSRDIPFPQDAGDRIYSAQLAAALTHANVEVRYVGYLQSDANVVPSDWVTDWVAVKGPKRGSGASMLSSYPRIAAIHATQSYKELLEQQLTEYWDAIVFDGYASGWALPMCLAVRAQRLPPHPLLIYVSHNHEERLWRDMMLATDRVSLRRLAIWQNYRKTRTLERDLLQHVDLVTTITAEDARSYREQQRQLNTRAAKIVLPPGYSGPMRNNRRITLETPRRVVLVGSYRWIPKQENLRRLVQYADQIFFRNNIVLDVIGDVPEKLLQELLPQVRATRFHGFVKDVSTYFDQARIALVPEVIGGGFKLKFLDYVFSRVPVATIAAAVAGIPPALASNMICCQDLEQLVSAVITDIDNVARLNRLQEQAFAHAAPLFRWDDRGQVLADKIRQIESRV